MPFYGARVLFARNIFRSQPKPGRFSHRAQSLRLIAAGEAAPTPTGFAEIVSDDFPVLHAFATKSVYDEADSVMETYEHKGEFKEG